MVGRRSPPRRGHHQPRPRAGHGAEGRRRTRIHPASRPRSKLLPPPRSGSGTGAALPGRARRRARPAPPDRRHRRRPVACRPRSARLGCAPRSWRSRPARRRTPGHGRGARRWRQAPASSPGWQRLVCEPTASVDPYRSGDLSQVPWSWVITLSEMIVGPPRTEMLVGLRRVASVAPPAGSAACGVSSRGSPIGPAASASGNATPVATHMWAWPLAVKNCCEILMAVA